jgi:hypothetical protein
MNGSMIAAQGAHKASWNNRPMHMVAARGKAMEKQDARGKP